MSGQTRRVFRCGIGPALKEARDTSVMYADACKGNYQGGFAMREITPFLVV